MKKEKAMYIIGGGFLGLNIIRWALELGLKTIVTDKDRKASGLLMADELLIADGMDIEKHIRFAKQMCKKYKIIGVYCGSEFGLWTIYYISKILGLETNSRRAIENVLDKNKMKKIWIKDKIPTPNGVVVKNINKLKNIMLRNKMPHVIKPIFGSGSQGVRIINYNNNESVFDNDVNLMDNKNPLLVEPYIEGRSIDANGIFLRGKFYLGGILEKFITPSPDCLPIGGYDPANISKEEVIYVYSLLKKSCQSIGLTFGPVKGDFIRKRNGDYIVLEVASRFHGDVTLSHTLPFGSKINPVKFYFQYLSTGKIKKSFLNCSSPNYATWRVICLPPGIFRNKLIQQPFSKNKQITIVWHNEKCNSKIVRYTDTAKIPGYICAYGYNQMDAEFALKKYFLNQRYDIEPNQRDKKWYKELGEKIESIGFSKKSCGFN